MLWNRPSLDPMSPPSYQHFSSKVFGGSIWCTEPFPPRNLYKPPNRAFLKPHTYHSSLHTGRCFAESFDNKLWRRTFG